jgi:hypothetical protein
MNLNIRLPNRAVVVVVVVNVVVVIDVVIDVLVVSSSTVLNMPTLPVPGPVPVPRAQRSKLMLVLAPALGACTKAPRESRRAIRKVRIAQDGGTRT